MKRLLKWLGYCKLSEARAIRSVLEADMAKENARRTKEYNALQRDYNELLMETEKLSKNSILYDFEKLTSIYKKSQLNALVYDCFRVASEDPEKRDLLERFAARLKALQQRHSSEKKETLES